MNTNTMSDSELYNEVESLRRRKSEHKNKGQNKIQVKIEAIEKEISKRDRGSSEFS